MMKSGRDGLHPAWDLFKAMIMVALYVDGAHDVAEDLNECQAEVQQAYGYAFWRGFAEGVTPYIERGHSLFG